MNSSKSFPPADDLLSAISKIDWKQVGQVTVQGLDYFLAIIEQIVMLVAALATVLYSKWKQHQVTEKIVQFVQKGYTFTRINLVPSIISTGRWIQQVGYPRAKSTYGALSDAYQVLTSRQFVTLN